MVSVIESIDDPKHPAYSNKFLQNNKVQLKEIVKNTDMLVEEFIIFFIAGTDTTSHVVHNILLELDKNLDKKDKL